MLRCTGETRQNLLEVRQQPWCLNGCGGDDDGVVALMMRRTRRKRRGEREEAREGGGWGSSALERKQEAASAVHSFGAGRLCSLPPQLLATQGAAQPSVSCLVLLIERRCRHKHTRDKKLIFSQTKSLRYPVMLLTISKDFYKQKSPKHQSPVYADCRIIKAIIKCTRTGDVGT